MKYVILIRSRAADFEHPVYAQDPAFLALPAAEQEALVRDSEAMFAEISASGELLDGVALGPPTDGPYLEAKEHLAGFFLVDCASAERAAAIAARFPDARWGAVEVRPVVG